MDEKEDAGTSSRENTWLRIVLHNLSSDLPLNYAIIVRVDIYFIGRNNPKVCSAGVFSHLNFGKRMFELDTNIRWKSQCVNFQRGIHFNRVTTVRYLYWLVFTSID